MVTWIWYIYSPLLWTSKSSEMHWIKRCLLSLLFQYLQKRQWTGSMPVPLLWTLKKASKCTLASSSLFLCSNISKNDNWPRNVCASALDLTLPSVCLVLSTPESSNVANNPSCVFAPALDPYSLKKPQKWALSVPISSKTRQKASMSAPLLWTSKLQIYNVRTRCSVSFLFCSSLLSRYISKKHQSHVQTTACLVLSALAFARLPKSQSIYNVCPSLCLFVQKSTVWRL